MTETLVCWKCGSALVDILQPLPRLAECPHCRAQLHVCRMCEYYDIALGQKCREPIAESVTDKQRANFCGYFQISAKAFSAPSAQAADSRRHLDTLFGDDTPASALQTGSPDELAREQLDELFKKGE